MKRRFFALVLGAGLLFSNYNAEAGNKPGGNKNNCIETTDITILGGTLGYMNKLQTVKGKLYNSSKDFVYDNIKLRVNYLDYMGNNLGSEDGVVSRSIKSGENDFFVEHVHSPKNTDHVTVDVLCAEQK